MPLRARFLDRDQDDTPSGSSGPDPSDYRAYSDDQLIEERERQQRTLEQLTLHPDRSSATCARLVATDGAIEQLTDELIRRARQRHPSSRGLAG